MRYIALGELEKTILENIWRKGAATVREVHNVVGRRRGLAYTTVMTVMTRLLDKKILCREELSDGSFLYKPCFSREEFYARVSSTIFTQLLKNFGSVAVAQFVDTLEEVDPKQLSLLKEKLKRR